MLPSFDWTLQSTEVPHPAHTASPTNAHAPPVPTLYLTLRAARQPDCFVLRMRLTLPSC